MRAIRAALSAARYGEAAERSITLEAELRREDSPPRDQLGWARHCAFRAAYEGGDHRRADDLLLSFDEQRHAIADENRAWMFSVGAELAAHQGETPAVDTWGERCYAIRRRLRSPECALRCALMVCNLLTRAGALADYPRWPQRVIAIGKAYGAKDVIALGNAYSA